MLFKILSVCKGGGYRYCKTEPPHPRRNSKGLYPLHRVIAENKLGRLLLKGEEVHHGSEGPEIDDPENLSVLTKAEHARLHQRGHLILTNGEIEIKWRKSSGDFPDGFWRGRIPRSFAGENNSQYGTCWIKHPITLESKPVSLSLVQKWLDLGWIKGRFIKKPE